MTVGPRVVWGMSVQSVWFAQMKRKGEGAGYEIQPFSHGYWAKLDAKVPYDYENERWPASAEIQVSYNFGPSWVIYADGLVGIGNDRPFDAGVGIGLRFKY